MAIRDTRPVRGTAFSGPISIQVLNIKSILAEWEETFALPPDQVQWIGPDSVRASPGSETRPNSSAPSPSVNRSGNMTVRTDDPRPRESEAGTSITQGTTR